YLTATRSRPQSPPGYRRQDRLHFPWPGLGRILRRIAVSVLGWLRCRLSSVLPLALGAVSVRESRGRSISSVRSSREESRKRELLAPDDSSVALQRPYELEGESSDTSRPIR